MNSGNEQIMFLSHIGLGNEKLLTADSNFAVTSHEMLFAVIKNKVDMITYEKVISNLCEYSTQDFAPN